MKYIAFLRGINVGGKNIIKMEDLRKEYESLGFNNVKTYIQSGNVIFETKETNVQKLKKKIEESSKKCFGTEIITFLKTIEELKELIKLNPFKKEERRYVTFIEQPIKKQVPCFSSKKDVEIIAIKETTLFSYAHEVNGQAGFPNSFIEKEFKTQATTRNWNTIEKIVKNYS